jgi:hypothetical protein
MPIERAASSMFFWVRRATIASSLLRSYFAPWPFISNHLRSPGVIAVPSPLVAEFACLSFQPCRDRGDYRARRIYDDDAEY